VSEASPAAASGSNAISVTLVANYVSYQKRLPQTLLAAGMLRRLIVFGAASEVQDPDGAGNLRVVKRFPAYDLSKRVVWGIWRRLPGTGRSKLPIAATVSIQDRLTAKWVPKSDFFHTCTGVSLQSMAAARRQGAISILENASMHPRHWQREVLAECKQFGVRPWNCDVSLPAPLIRRRELEYDLCDRIVVPSSVARQSFEEFGYGKKVEVMLRGVDHTVFRPPDTRGPRDFFRVCFVGRIELAKGVPYLLRAWKRLALRNAELLLIGTVQPEIAPILKEYGAANIRLTGWVPPQELAEHYRQSDLFVMPSVNEGLALVILEAMASGLPIVATDRSGAADVVDDGKEGFVVPARNVDALVESIRWCSEHRAEASAMAKTARAKVEAQFTIPHYEARVIRLYESVIQTIRD
jgi:glycosyltransferase involved in cell wall biosynthesis